VRTKDTLAAELSSTETGNAPGRGHRLRDAYWARHGGFPRNPKRVSPAVVRKVLGGSVVYVHLPRRPFRRLRGQRAVGF